MDYQKSKGARKAQCWHSMHYRHNLNTKHSIHAIPNSGDTMENMWKIPTRFSAFLNKQFAEIFYTKRLELHLCDMLPCLMTRLCQKTTPLWRKYTWGLFWGNFTSWLFCLMVKGGRRNYMTYSQKISLPCGRVEHIFMRIKISSKSFLLFLVWYHTHIHARFVCIPNTEHKGN